jgi:DNA-binding NtrC family response regulator
LTARGNTPPVLYVDDEPENLALFRMHFETLFEVRTAASGAAALIELERGDVAVLLTDERMPGMSGIDLLALAAERWPDVVRVIVSAYSDAARLLAAINRGHAHEYILKPWDELELKGCVERALMTAQRRRELQARAERSALYDEEQRARADSSGLIGLGGGLDAVAELARRAAAVDSTVLLLGETGTGKELFARFIHDHSARRDQPFIAVNCAALAEGLLESELFGHEAGAFTGAQRLKRGRFELAAGGTLFLDEVGEIAPRVQVSLLRVLQERRLERVGGGASIAVDARVVAATNRNLEERVQAGSFRADLYFRLNVIPLTVPPLRERPQDIAPLVQHFVAKWAGRRPPPPVPPDVIEALLTYGWPGNVRELENLVQRALVLSHGGPLTVEDFSFQCQLPAPSVRQEARDAESRKLRELLLFHGGNCARAAAALGIPRTTLVSRLKKYALL